jgi:CspA family cold shock protein
MEEEERNLEEKKFLRLNGKVKWFSDAKGYGFIEREDKEKDIFVHFSAVKDAGLKYLKEGDQLTFEVANTDKGSSAINLQKTF